MQPGAGKNTDGCGDPGGSPIGGPGRKIRKLLYCPLKEDRLFYGRFPECVVCTGEPELEAALDGCQVLLADPCFAPWLAVHCPDCRLVPLPYPALGIYAF